MLVQQYNSNIISLQETFVKGEPTYKGFTAYYKEGTTDAMGRRRGGVVTFVQNNIPQSEVQLNTNLQAVATRVTLNVTFTICSIYIPPPDIITITDLDNILQQLPQPAILLGDFNALIIITSGMKSKLQTTKVGELRISWQETTYASGIRVNQPTFTQLQGL